MFGVVICIFTRRDLRLFLLAALMFAWSAVAAIGLAVSGLHVTRPALAAVVGLVALPILVSVGLLILIEAQSRRSSRRDMNLAFQAAPEAPLAHDNAEAARRTTSERLADMSIEVGAPLRGVLAMVQAIERDALSSAQRVRVEVVHQSAGALLGSLDDILDRASIEAGGADVAIKPFDLADLILSVSASFTAASVSAGRSLEVAMAPDAAGCWLGDAAKLRRFVAHVFDSALDGATACGVKLEVACDGDGLVFRIEEIGVGFDPQIGEALFDDGVRGDAPMTREPGGGGLAHSPCWALVQSLGGVVSANDDPGRDDGFTVRLSMERTGAPIPKPKAAAPTPTPSPGAAASVQVPEASPMEDEPQTLRVLAAEDNPTNQLVLRALLRTMEVDLTVVENGRLALEAFVVENFDLILMDIQMPEMNGVDAARAIRTVERQEGRASTPIIALTANVMPDQLAEYRAAGMDDCVAKPVDLERLFSAMAAALDGPAQDHPSQDGPTKDGLDAAA